MTRTIRTDEEVDGTRVEGDIHQVFGFVNNLGFSHLQGNYSLGCRAKHTRLYTLRA